MTIDSNHTYQIDGHTFKQSVTGLVESLCPPFEAELIAPKVALKEGVETQVILDKWNLNGQVSRDFGNAIDKGIEYWLLHKELPSQPVVAQITKTFAEMWGDKTGLPQYAVYNTELSLCGTMDIWETRANKHCAIHDIKTGDMYKAKKKKMLAPFKELEATAYNKYQVQLNLYRHLLELIGWTVDEMLIWNFNGEWKMTKVDMLDVKQIWN